MKKYSCRLKKEKKNNSIVNIILHEFKEKKRKNTLKISLIMSIISSIAND